MIKKNIKNLIKYFGYDIYKVAGKKEHPDGYTQYEFLNKDGSFNYEKYKSIQEKGNTKKIDRAWVQEENIAFLSKYIKANFGQPSFGICHGTRRGYEQTWFKQYLDCEMIGTEISSTATQFPLTIQWDFHDENPDWADKADFIYSNSFDHAYDPEKCLSAWMMSLKKGGCCIIEHSSIDESKYASEMDPFGANITLLPYLILKWGKGMYHVTNILEAPKKMDYLNYLSFIVIKKNR